MAIPKTVQRQLAEAEAIQQRLQEQAVQAPPVLDNVANLSAQAPAPVEAAPAPPAPAPVSTPVPAAPAEDWQHKFKTLQGMYNSEAARFQTQLKVYQSQLATLEEQIQSLTVASKAKVETKPQVDPRDASQFGEDLVEMVSRYASRAFEQMRSEFGQYAQNLDARIKDLEGKVNGVDDKTATTMNRMFIESLTKAVPDWQQVNQMSRWLEWLGEEDELYGMTRQNALDDAHGKLDVRRVAAIFNKFKSDVLAKQPTLETQVAPPAGAPAAPPASPGQTPQLISQKAINQFYLDFAKGRYKGREDEFARLEAEINLAIAQGRVV